MLPEDRPVRTGPSKTKRSPRSDRRCRRHGGCRLNCLRCRHRRLDRRGCPFDCIGRTRHRMTGRLFDRAGRRPDCLRRGLDRRTRLALCGPHSLAGRDRCLAYGFPRGGRGLARHFANCLASRRLTACAFLACCRTPPRYFSGLLPCFRLLPCCHLPSPENADANPAPRARDARPHARTRARDCQSEKLVERKGIEPSTSALRTQRSPS